MKRFHIGCVPCADLEPESGRIFVWGENQFGQLSAGSKEVIAKPSCIKEIKNLGYKVRNIAFGGAFSVILTGTFELKKLHSSQTKKYKSSVRILAHFC